MNRGTFFARTFDSLRSSVYRPFFIGFIIAMAGFWMRIATVGWLVYEITGSTESLGLVTAASLLPFVFFAPWGGAIADRMDERRLIVTVLGGVVVMNVGLGFWLLANDATFEVIFGYALLVGALRGVEVPARHALVVRLVGRERLYNAIGLNAASFHLMAAFGPVLAGSLYHVVGPAACFFAVGLSAVPFALIVRRLKLVAPGPVHDGASVRRDVLEGFSYVFSHRRTRALFLAPSASVLLLWSFRTLMPAVSRDVLRLDELGYGVLMGVLGVGSLIGALVVASGATQRIQSLRALLPFVAGGSVGVAVVGVATTPVLVGVGLLLAGFCQVAFMATANTQVQLEVPDRLRARVMGVWALSFGLCWPIGSLVTGWIAEWKDTEFALLAGAGATLVSVVLLITITRRGQASIEA